MNMDREAPKGNNRFKTWKQLMNIIKINMLFIVDHVFNINEKDEI